MSPLVMTILGILGGGAVIGGALVAIDPLGARGKLPNGAYANRVVVACVPGQTEGKFLTPGGMTWEWSLAWGHSMQVANYQGVMGENDEWRTVARFDEALTPEQKCQIVTDYFRGIGVGR